MIIWFTLIVNPVASKPTVSDSSSGIRTGLEDTLILTNSQSANITSNGHINFCNNCSDSKTDSVTISLNHFLDSNNKIDNNLLDDILHAIKKNHTILKSLGYNLLDPPIYNAKNNLLQMIIVWF